MFHRALDNRNVKRLYLDKILDEDYCELSSEDISKMCFNPDTGQILFIISHHKIRTRQIYRVS